MRIRHHVNPLAVHYGEFRGMRPTIAAGAIVEVEIGCAEARFLFERAAADPLRTYIGLDIREELVALVNRRARAAGVPIYAVFCQAQLHLGEIFDAGSVDRVYLNFPDPWFKRRHQNRRMIDAALAAGIVRITRPGAEVFVQSDIWEIALDAMSVLEQTGALANLAGEWSFWRAGNPYGARSWRELNAEETLLPIWRLRFRRR